MCLRTLGWSAWKISWAAFFSYGIQQLTAQKAPRWPCLGQGCDCGSQRLRALFQLWAGGVPWGHMMFGLKGQAKECFSHPALTSEVWTERKWAPPSCYFNRVDMPGHWNKRPVSEPGPLGLQTLTSILKPLREHQDIGKDERRPWKETSRSSG